ncbi:MAG: hypothetical protein ABJZ55_15000 [Fuerstiella sp.]
MAKRKKKKPADRVVRKTGGGMYVGDLSRSSISKEQLDELFQKYQGHEEVVSDVVVTCLAADENNELTKYLEEAKRARRIDQAEEECIDPEFEVYEPPPRDEAKEAKAFDELLFRAFVEWLIKVERFDATKLEDDAGEVTGSCIDEEVKRLRTAFIGHMKSIGDQSRHWHELNWMASHTFLAGQASSDVWIQEFDKSFRRVAPSSPMPQKDAPDPTPETPTDEIDGLIQHAFIHGKETLTSLEWKAIAKHATQAAKEFAKSEAIATVQRLAHELFPELKADQRATANRLTKLFAKHGSGQIDDEAKLKFVELTRAWKAAGGSLEYDGQAVRLDTKPFPNGSQVSFTVDLAKKGRTTLTSSINLPAIQFSL